MDIYNTSSTISGCSMPSKKKRVGGRKQSAPKKRKVDGTGCRALQEIRKYQGSIDLLLRKAPFRRVVRQITHDEYTRPGESLRFQATALEAIQVAAEEYIVCLFQEALLCCLHAKRSTLMVRDVQLARRLRGPNSE